MHIRFESMLAAIAIGLAFCAIAVATGGAKAEDAAAGAAPPTEIELKDSVVNACGSETPSGTVVIDLADSGASVCSSADNSPIPPRSTLLGVEAQQVELTIENLEQGGSAGTLRLQCCVKRGQLRCPCY